MSELLDRCGEQLTKAWDLPDIPTGRVSSSHPSSSSELAEIFGRSDDEDEEFETFGSEETQLNSAGIIQRSNVASMAEILADSKISLNSAQQLIKGDKAKAFEEPRRSARLQSASKCEIEVVANKNEETSWCKERNRERAESGSDGIYSEGSDAERKSSSEEEGDDPDKLWCICRKPHGDRFMICCDRCEEWYHGDCIGISISLGKRMERYGEDYVCMLCREKERCNKEEKKYLRTERLEKREAQKSKEFEEIGATGTPELGGSGLFVPDNLPMGKNLTDVKPKRPAIVDVNPKKIISKDGGVKCLHCYATVDPPTVMCSSECIHKHVKRGIEILAIRGVNVAELEGVAVVDKSSGRVIVGGAAPKRKELFDWLQSHRTYQIHLPVSRSSTSKEPGYSQVTKATNNSASVRENAKKLLAQALWQRCETAGDDIKSIATKEQVEHLANDIEEDLFSLHNNITIKYKNKYRSLLFNLRDPKNQGLFQKVVRGQLETKELVTLSSEQLASDELMQWRQQEIKKHLEKIKEREEEINRDSSGTKRKITYKGEIEIEATEKEQALSSERPQIVATVVSPHSLSSLTSPGLPVNTTSQHGSHTFDANCDICQGKLVTTSVPPISVSATKEKLVDVDKPLRSPDVSDVSSKPLYVYKWKGLISMPTFTKFVATAHGISGAADYMLELLPDILNVEGRIRFNQVWEYLTKLQVSSSRDVSVVCFQSVSEADDQANYIALLDYLVGRDRCGVVAHGDREIKDFYLVPLIAGSPIPQQLPADCKRVLSDDDSREDVLLGVIVHSKVLGRSKQHRRHKRSHHTSTDGGHKRSRLDVGIGNVTPPEMDEPTIRLSVYTTAPPTVTSATPTITSSGMPTVTSLPSTYGMGENEVTSTSITHFSAGIKDDIVSDTAYSPSDEVEKTIVLPPVPNNPPSEEIVAPLSPNIMSRLQSLIQTVKDSMAGLPGKQEEESAMVTSIDNETKSAYVFHETLPVTTSVTMVTNPPVSKQHAPQHPDLYDNQYQVYHSTPPPKYGDKRFEPHHHDYQLQRDQWAPYRSNWPPQR